MFGQDVTSLFTNSTLVNSQASFNIIVSVHNKVMIEGERTLKGR